MGDETQLFRNKLKAKLPHFLFAQIESHKSAPGFPDTDYLLKGSTLSGKVELKYERTSFNRIDLRKTQVVWLRRYARNGGRCYVAVKLGASFIYVWKGKHSLELRKGMDIWNIPHYECELQKNGWEEFGDVLMGVHDDRI